MKNIVKALVFVTVALFSFNAQAQDKFGHLDSSVILALMPETKNAEKAIQNYAVELENQLKAMYSEYESKLAEYQEGEALMTDVVKQSKITHLEDLQLRINQFQQTSQADLQKRRNDALKPILEEAQNAVNEVAEENGYTYIFDISTGTVVFKTDANDVTPLVKAKLGIQ